MAQHHAGLGGTKLINVAVDKWTKVARVMEKDCAPGQPDYRDHDTTLRDIFQFQAPIFGLIGGVMMRRSLIGQTRFRQDLYIGEDFYFIYENLIKGASSVYLERWWYYCRIHPTSVSRDVTYEAFLNRYLRRELVWQSEEALGRPENVRHQKISVFHIYLSAILSGRMEKSQRKQMIRFMKSHKKVLLDAMYLTGKVKFYLFVYLPFTYPLLHKLKK